MHHGLHEAASWALSEAGRYASIVQVADVTIVPVGASSVSVVGPPARFRYTSEPGPSLDKPVAPAHTIAEGQRGDVLRRGDERVTHLVPDEHRRSDTHIARLAPPTGPPDIGTSDRRSPGLYRRIWLTREGKRPTCRTSGIVDARHGNVGSCRRCTRSS